MPREQRDVFGALAQAWQSHADHVEAVIQVLAERSFAHPLLQVLVRRCDHAHVRLELLMAADAVERPIRQDPQQARLQLGGHVADLIEEQRPAFGLLEAAAPLLLRAGERATLVAEELGLEQVLRHRGGIDGDEGLRGACAMTVQGPRHKLLAGARFARNEDRRARLG